MFIFNVTGTSDFKAAQWGGFPNGDLTANLTGVTFGGYGAYKPGITLPRIYKPLQAGQIIAFHADNNRFIKMQCSGCDMQGSPEKAIDQLPSALGLRNDLQLLTLVMEKLLSIQKILIVLCV